MAKLEITICTGTTCYVMGAGNLLLLEEKLSEAQLQQVEIKGASCMGLCKQGQHGQAPYVMVGDTLITEATTEAIQEELNKRLGELYRGDV